MIGKHEKARRLATIPEVSEILEERKKDGDLGYEQQLAYEYAKKFAKVDKEKAEKLKEGIEGLGVSERTAIMIVNTMPVDVMQLKQILSNEKKVVEGDLAEKIFGVVESHRGK